MPSGQYDGRAVVELLEDGRRVRLVNPFAYIDPGSKRWDVPDGAIVDGASIPRTLWTLIGGPFEGKYRNASIVHDWFCDRRTRPWKQVHRMFFDAMITSGVSGQKARLLYAGVYFGGPRWSKTVVENNTLVTTTPINRAVRSPDGASGGGRLRFAGPVKSTREVRTKKTVTVLHKYSFKADDLDWLNQQVKGPSQSLNSIEHMVDKRLAKRTPRKRTL
jgi:hypothetical protein